MEDIFITESKSTPEIRFDKDEKLLSFIGKSFPTDPVIFYKPVFAWLENFLSNKQADNNLNVHFKLDYYNTSSSKQFAKLFKLLNDSEIRDGVRVVWHYDPNDIDMFDAGQRFSQFYLLKFELVKNQQ